jgi:colanic acid/amylovoran biosynthesis glycosyltransferase
MTVTAPENARRIVVVHSTPVWLPVTMPWLHKLVTDLDELRVASHIACDQVRNLDLFPVANTHSIDQLGRVTQLWYRAIRRLDHFGPLTYLCGVAKDVGASIVHSHFGHIGWLDRSAVAAAHAKHVVSFYGFDVNQLPTMDPRWRSRYEALFSVGDRFLCEGTHMARCLVALGCPVDKIRIHHLGIDIDQMEFRPRSWRAGSPLRVLMAASFREKKGIPYGIRALGVLAQRIPLEVTIIGDAEKGATGAAIKDEIMVALAESGLGSQVRLMGFQPHSVLLREAYSNHIFLHPSVTAHDGDTEGGAPVSISEMLATGMPVVSTLHCDIPEVVGPTLRSFLAPERDVVALVSCLDALTSQSNSWSSFLLPARMHLESEYHRERQSRRLEDHYREVIHS